jgi:hypothetical protein
MYAGFCFITGTGLLIKYRLSPCSEGGDHGQSLLGMDRHAWGEWHLWVAYAVIAILVFHVMLNLTFVIKVVAAKSRLFLSALAIGGILIILFFLLAPLHKEPGGRKCGENSACSTCPSAGGGCPSAAGGSCSSAETVTPAP